MLVHRLLGREDHPGCAICDLRAVASGHLAPGPLERGLELGEALDGAVRPHPVVEVVDLAVTGKRSFQLTLEPAFLLRMRQPLLALGGVLIGVAPRNVEEMREHLGGLAHIELDHRVGEPAFEPDHRLEEFGPEACHRLQARPEITRRGKPCIPVDGALAEDERGMAERIGAAGENEIGMAFADVAIRRVDRLHAGAAIDLHGERGHLVAHSEPQRGDPRRVHLVGDDVDATEDHLVERIRRERLAQQQWPAAGDGEVDRRERTRPPARPDERGAGAVDDIDRSGGRYSAALGRLIACDSTSPRARRGDSSWAGKSSTATAAATASASARSNAASASLISPCWRALSMS